VSQELLLIKANMYSVADIGKIFLLHDNVTDYKNDFHQYFEQNASNQTIINYEQEGSVMSEPMSLSSSPLTTDGNYVHNPMESSQRRDNDLCCIYEIRILYERINLRHSIYPALKLTHFTSILFNIAPFHSHTSTQIINPQISVSLQKLDRSDLQGVSQPTICCEISWYLRTSSSHLSGITFYERWKEYQSLI
jgi:hypothetical protein